MTNHPLQKPGTDSNIIAIHEPFEHAPELFKMISARAFDLFEKRGCANGHDQEDWFLAESELLTPVKFQLSESREHLKLHAEVPGLNREEIAVSLNPRRLTISGKAGRGEDHSSGEQSQSKRHAQSIYGVVDLPVEVDLSNSRATFDDGALEVFMPKATAANSLLMEANPPLSSKESAVPASSEIETSGKPLVGKNAKKKSAKAKAASGKS